MSPSRRFPWLPLFTALGLLWYAASLPRFLTPDTVEILQFAACLEGALHSPDVGACLGAGHWSPGLPLLLTFLAPLGLSPIVTVRLLSLLCAALLPIPIFVLARALAARPAVRQTGEVPPPSGTAPADDGVVAGLWAAALVVPLVVIRVYALLPDARLPALLATFSAYAALACWLEGGRRRPLFVCGALAGAVFLLRPEGKLTLALILVATALAAVIRTHALRSASPVLDATAHRSIPLLLNALVAPLPLALGALAVIAPALLVLQRLSGPLPLEPRAWELPLVGWIPIIPLKLFRPLFDLGAQATPLRERFQEALQSGQIEVSIASRLEILLGSFIGQGGEMLRVLAGTVPLELVLLAAVGVYLTLRTPRGGARVALWALALCPLLPLAALPQTFNPRLPEGNLLFVPLVLALMSGVALAGLQRRLAARAPRLTPLVMFVLAAAFTARGAVSYAGFREARGGTLFESSPAVQRAARWLELNSTPSDIVRTTYPGAVVPMLANRARQPWPSTWEIPLWLMGPDAARTLVVITSIDQADDPLAVAEWKKADPRLELLHHEEGRGVWLAIMARRALSTTPLHNAPPPPLPVGH